MKYLLVFLLMHGVLGHYRFGQSYLENSLLCKPWVCINQHLNINTSPTQAEYGTSIKKLVPADWHPAVDKAVGLCFAVDMPRQYTNTCPGQALLHCLIDNLIEHCPESNLRQDDACAPVASLAGFKYMFSQSRYENLEKYLPTERRPVWFLKNYFSTKCCDLPQIFNGSVLNGCGFNSLMHYYGHEPRPKINFLPVAANLQSKSPSTPAPTPEAVRVVEVAEVDDLMSCCDLSEFISPQSRVDCNFSTLWDSQNRLSIQDKEPNPDVFVTSTTTTAPPPPVKHHDVKVVPLNCQSETCVFAQLNITTVDGKVDKDAFSKLLDNWTKKHPEWTSAKARVVTKCLTRALPEYKNECELNSVLGCVFDVLSENCPSNKKTVKDPCKHVHELKDDTICTINSSKFRPKNRRLFCDFPNFVDHTALAKCNVSSIYKIESAPEASFRKNIFQPRFYTKPSCKETTPSSLCLLSKMGVLNKYNFMDYFKMKDRIRQFTNNEQWSALNETCPVSKRQNTPKCNKMFEDMAKNYTDTPKTKIDQIYKKMFEKFPPKFTSTTENIAKKSEKNSNKKMHPLLGYGMFGGVKVPPVNIIPIKPQIIKKENRKPLIVLPVYSRTTVQPSLTLSPEHSTTQSPHHETPENSNTDTTSQHNPQFTGPQYPFDYKKSTALMNLLDRYRFPREFTFNTGNPDFIFTTPSPFYGPFHQDALLRGGVKFERPFTNGHSGNELGIDEVTPE